MVDEPRQITTLGRINDVVPVDPEEVGAADALPLIHELPLVRHGVPHVLTDLLDHHFVRGDWLQREQAPVVDGRLAELELLLTELPGGGGGGVCHDFTNGM